MAGEPSRSTGTSARGERASALAKPITLSDLTEELLWPHLFRAVPLALRPERLGLAFFTLVVLGMLGRIVAPAPGSPVRLTQVMHNFAQSVQAHSVEGCVSAYTTVFLGISWDQIEARPWVSAAVAVPAVLVLILGVGAISRMAACEFAQSVMVPWTRGLAFSISKLASMAGAVVGPLLVAALMLVIVALGGGALFNWSGSAVIGALLYPIALVLGAVAVLLMLGFALGNPMLVPAVTCEGTDAIDAAQRAYAYVVGRPLRLLVYMAILFAVLIVGVTLLEILVFRTIEVTRAAAASLAGESAARALSGPGDEVPGAWGWAERIVTFWTMIPRMLVGAFILSYGACASTILYLLMRKLNDGQDTSEVWMPGMVGGTLAPIETPGNGEADEE